MGKRQSNGTGTFVRRKDGLYEYRVSLGIGLDGKRLRKSFYGKTKSAAVSKYKDWLKNSENIPIERVTTVGEWADKWLELYKKGKVSYITYSDYAGYIRNQIKPLLGRLRLEQVRPAHIQAFFAKVGKVDRKGEPIPGSMLSDSARRKLLIILNNLFETAIENRFCTENPARSVKLERQPQREIEVYTSREIKAILDYMPRHAAGRYMAIMLYSGMRIGELLALQWSDVDLENQVITVRRALKHTPEGDRVGNTPKSKRIRVIPISGALGAVLESLPRRSPFVVPNARGGHHTHASFDTVYYGFLDDLNAGLPEGEKVRRLSPHKCRHSFATYSVKSGVPIAVLQQILGHAQISTTQIYTHVDTDDLKKNIQKLRFA